MAVRIRAGSRLQFSTLRLLGGVECWDLPEYPLILPAEDDVEYMVQGNDRIDRLAELFYGDPQLWYVIALANDLRLLPTDLYPDRVLKIPSSTRVFSKILRTRA
jgi:nucleoid-associated protein YgaU